MLLVSLFFFGTCISGSLGAVCTYEGSRYEENDTWRSKGFLWKCGFDGQPGVIGCVSADTDILLNEYRIMQGFNRTCYEDMGKYFLSEIYCGDKCNGGPQLSAPTDTSRRPTPHRPRVRPTVPVATTKKVVPLEQRRSCISSDGIVIKAGARDERGDLIRVCEIKSSGVSYSERKKTLPEIAASLDAKSLVIDDKCEKDGKSYSVGEIWVGKGFKFLCKPKGAYEIVACVSPNAGLEVPIDRIIERNGWKLNCTRDGHNVFLKEEYMGRKPQSSKTTELTCTHNGKVLRHGQRWVTKKFRYECNKKGAVDIIGCVAKDGYELAVGKTVDAGEFVRSCTKVGNAVVYNEKSKDSPKSTQSSPTSSPVRKLEGRPCIYNSKAYKLGESWTSDSFKFKCGELGFGRVVACVTKNGMEVDMNMELMQNGVKHRCYFQNGAAQYEAVPMKEASRGCRKNGKNYADGETWTANGFRYKCMDTGRLTIIACVTDDLQEVAVGATKTFGGLVHECIKEGNRYMYRADFPKQ